MKILYDHQCFTGLRYGGVARYFYELMNAHAQSQDIDFELALQFSNNEYINDAAFSHHQNFSTFISYVGTNRMMSLVNRLNSLKYIKTGNFDVFHPTYYHKYFLNHLEGKPFVITFHDCTNEKFHDLYPDLGGNIHALKQNLLDCAAKVIAVSENTKNEMMHYFRVHESKIEVIYHGTTFSESQRLTDFRLKLPHNFLLHVGNRLDFKNFNNFVTAIVPLLKKNKDLFVVCAGGGSFRKEERQHFASLGVSNQVMYHEIGSDENLQEMYQRAIALVCPSLNEGFGLPIIEAFSSRCPVILSETSCFPEIAQEAGLYFDPLNMDSMLHATEKVVLDNAIRQNLIDQGAMRSYDFSLQKTAKQTIGVYESVMNNPVAYALS